MALTQRLPAFGSTVCQPPRYEAVHAVLVQVAAQDRLRAERRAAEQLAAGGEVDQVEDLAAVMRIDPHQQLG